MFVLPWFLESLERKRPSQGPRLRLSLDEWHIPTVNCVCSDFLLQDLMVDHPQAALLFCDNKVARHIAVNQFFHEQTKHIELDCQLICDKIQEMSVVTEHSSKSIFS